MFFYLLFKVGVLQCVGRSVCKMTWAACNAYWNALEDMSCFLWHKIRNTKRVYHRHVQGIEDGFSSSTDDVSSESFNRPRYVRRQRRSVRERRKEQMRRSLYPMRLRSKSSRRMGGSSHHHVRLKTSEVSVHVKGSRRSRKKRRAQFTNASFGHVGSEMVVFKRKTR
ncbi:hypothetical protein QJS10_CPA01g00068 [Acorus calamus]|uniref:Uncharacterized protein n=1 Tax=Acorus calamus TaxID=4465 RepID=A0AAV9FJE3_ACOCL|nr:hypothetical protein QJS10_CPA01g00068 [Acorus calamus]